MGTDGDRRDAMSLFAGSNNAQSSPPAASPPLAPKAESTSHSWLPVPGRGKKNCLSDRMTTDGRAPVPEAVMVVVPFKVSEPTANHGNGGHRGHVLDQFRINWIAQHQALIRSIDKIPSTSKVRPAMCETTGSGVKEGETVLMADDMTFQVGTIYLAVDNGMELRKI